MWGEVDYYNILGVSAAASEEEIKSAYRALARRYHPDTAEVGHVTQMFRDVHEAYTILLDQEQRKNYDRWRITQGLDEKLDVRLEVFQSLEQMRSVDEPQMFYVVADVLAGVSTTSDRLPINLCLVIDRSTSMKGARLQKVKEATRDIIDSLGSDDVLSVVTFSDRAQVIIAAQNRINKVQAKGAVNSIQAGGGTEIHNGMLEGMRQVNRWLSFKYVNHIILLTDGQTYGDEDLCIDAARRTHSRNFSISTVGIGSDWNDKLLDEIAEQSGGGSHFLEGADDINLFFQKKVQQLADVFAQDASLSVHTYEGTSLCGAYRISPMLMQLSVAEARFELGAVGVKAGPGILLELLVPPKAVGKYRLAQLSLKATLPVMGKHSDVHLEHPVSVSFVDGMPDVQQVPQRIVSVLNKVSIYQMQQKAMAEVEKGRLSDATRYLEAVATRLLDMGETELAKAALLEVNLLKKTGTLSPEGKKRLKYGTRNLASGELGSGKFED